MKTFTHPQPAKVPTTIIPNGLLAFALFVREQVLTREAFRAPGNAALTIEIDKALDGEPGTPCALSEAAHELLSRELAFPGQMLMPLLVRPLADFQLEVASAK